MSYELKDFAPLDIKDYTLRVQKLYPEKNITSATQWSKEITYNKKWDLLNREEQKAFFHLDSAPETLTAEEHRPAYASDGDYFSNPNAEDVFERIYQMMHEANPKKYVKLY